MATAPTTASILANVIDKVDTVVERQIVQGKAQEDLRTWLDNGLSKRIAKDCASTISGKFAEVEKSIAYIKGKVDGIGGGPSKKTVTIRRILETAITVGIFALVIGGVVLFLAGRLSIDDIIRILEARAGTG